MYPDLAWPRNARTLTRHQVPVMMPPLPCTATHRRAPATPHFAGHVTETDRFPTGPGRHRRSYLPPWTQRTTPSRSTVPADQSRPDETTLDRDHVL
jgi:hypothetical protein